MVNLYGYFNGSTGYNVCTQYVMKALVAEFKDELNCIPYDQVPADAFPPSEHRYFRHAEPKDVSVAVTYGNDVGRFCGRKRIVHTVWETTKLPSDWPKELNKVDGIVTQTPFTLDVFRNSGVTTPIHIIPETVNPIFNPFAQKLNNFNPKNEFTFLSVGKLEPRKGQDILVKAFIEEFKVDEPVRLVLSCFNPWMQGNFEANYLRFLYQNKVPFDYLKDDKITYLPYIQDRRMFPSVYTSCNAFVLPTRAESWCAPAFESMACGLPTIVTNWSGQQFFINSDVAYPIPAKEVEVPENDRLYAGSVWAEPDFEELKAIMRKVYSEQEASKAVGKRAASYIKENFNARIHAKNWKAVVESYE